MCRVTSVARHDVFYLINCFTEDRFDTGIDDSSKRRRYLADGYTVSDVIAGDFVMVSDRQRLY